MSIPPDRQISGGPLAYESEETEIMSPPTASVLGPSLPILGAMKSKRIYNVSWRLAGLGLLAAIVVSVLMITKPSASMNSTASTGSTVSISSTEAFSATATITLPNPGFEHGLENWTSGLNMPDVPNSNKGYSVTLDTSVLHTGKVAARLESTVAQPSIIGALSSQIEARQVKTKRVRYSAYLRTEDVAGWTGLDMYVYRDLPGTTTLDKLPMSWDQMFDRRVQGTTDWQQYEIVLDVPAEASLIVFGVELSGPGRVWTDDVQIGIVSDDVPSTDQGDSKYLRNLDFENGLADWTSYTMMTTVETEVYTTGTGTEMARTGNLGAYIRSTGPPQPNQYAELGPPTIYAGYYQGKTVRFSAYINADKVKDHASLWAVSPTKDAQGHVVAIPSETLVPGRAAQNGNTAGSQEQWQRYEVSIRIPDNAPNFIFEIRLFGEGEIWIDDVQFEVLN